MQSFIFWKKSNNFYFKQGPGVDGIAKYGMNRSYIGRTGTYYGQGFCKF